MRSEHRGHEIAFDADREVWGCATLGLENASLKALKRAIDGESKKRRTVNVGAYYLEDGYYRTAPSLRKVVITLLRHGDKKCQVRDGKKGSSEVDLCNCFALDQKPALDAYVAEKKAAKAADDRADKLREKVKAFTASDVREIVARQADEATT